MFVTADRIGYYFSGHKCLPSNLGALPPCAGDAGQATDVWGHPIQYVVDGNDSFTLVSLGRNGVVGGSGDDADIVERYQIVRGQAQEIPPSTRNGNQ